MYVRTYACMHALHVSEGVSVSSQEDAAGSRWCPSPAEDWNTALGAGSPSPTGAAPLPSRSAGKTDTYMPDETGGLTCKTDACRLLATFHESAPYPRRET